VLLLFIVLKNTLFSFAGPNDPQFIESAGFNFVSALRKDRARMLTNDSIRSLLFVIAIAVILFALLKNKIKTTLATIAIGLLLCVDLVPVAWRYVNTEGFVSAKQIDTPFRANTIDKKILTDTSRYRVFDMSANPMNTARTSFFHNSVGGYHGAKPKRIQELFDFHMSQSNQSVLNMLNVKYFIFKDDKGVLGVQRNEEALGNAWFIEIVNTAKHPNEEIQALNKLDFAYGAIIPKNNSLSQFKFPLDSLATIKLVSEHPHELKYISENQNKGFGVFSEMYYKEGWKAFIDGTETEILKTNYAIRGIEIPAGKHNVVFKFEPQVVKTGSLISLIASIILILIIAGSIFYYRKQSNNSI